MSRKIMVNVAQKFFKEMLDPNGKISAPQTIGVLFSLISCILALCSYPSDILIPMLSASGTLLVGGSFEVYTQKKWGS